MFSVTSRGGSRLGPWKTMPMRPGRPAGLPSRPGQAIVPLVGVSRPASRCRSVDFPDPDGPVSATCMPGRSVQLTPRSACTSPAPDP